MAHSTLEDISEAKFTSSTIKRMYRLIDKAKTDADFQKLVYSIVNRKMGGEWKNYRGELEAVFNFFKSNVDYRRDPYGVELLQDVWATLDRKRGDCDDATIWLGAAAEILGSPVRIVTVSTRADREPSHVYPEAYVGGSWVPMDATVKGSTVGWFPSSVTDKKIWTRREVGLPGGEDLNGIEGLGMIGNGYSDIPGFETDMAPAAGKLAPGIPDDISMTYADPSAGTSMLSRRKYFQAPIANVSDFTSNPRPGGGVYNPARPIKSMPTPDELWYLVDRGEVPSLLNPDKAWWNGVPTARENRNRMLPTSNISSRDYMVDIASVPNSAIAAIASDVKCQMDSGEIKPHEAEKAIEEGLKDFAAGRTLRMNQLPSQRRARDFGRGASKKGSSGEPVKVAHSPAGVAGLGSILDDIAGIAKSISNSVVTGVIPGDTSSINQAINQAVDAKLGPKPTPPVNTATMAKAAIPISMIGLVLVVALLMGMKGKKRSYRNNPSRRRSRRRYSSRRGSRRGGKSFFQEYQTPILLTAAGGAAYYFLLRPGATLLPQAYRPSATPAITVVKPPTLSTSQLLTAGAIKAAPSIFDSIAKLFQSTPEPSASQMSMTPTSMTA